MKRFIVKTYGDFNHGDYMPHGPAMAIRSFILWANVIIHDYEKFGYKVDISPYKEYGIVINATDLLGVCKGLKSTIVMFKETK